jgi:amino acid adenylation domain-containing protein
VDSNAYHFLVPRDIRILPELLALGDRAIPAAAPALSDGTDALDYGEYTAAAGRVASALRQLGVEPGDRVGIHLRKSVWSFVAVHGVLRAGAVMVPIDPLAPVDHVTAVLDDASVGVLLTDARIETVAALAADVGLTGVILRSPADASVEIDVAGCAFVGWSSVAELDVAPIPDVGEVDPDDDAYVIYTSGSTGRPKGIVHTHRSALAYARLAAAAYGLEASDRLANIAGLHFDQSTFELYVAPFVGAAVTVVPDAVLRFPASVSELVERERVTVWYSVPYVLRQLVTRGALDTRDLTSIRWILYGGESYPPDELADLMRALPAATVSNVYGPAEVNQCTRHDLAEPPSGDVPIGRAWDETELVVVDERGAAVTGVPGELLVASTTMMDRYWNRPDLSAAAIVERAYPGAAATRWYRTGDLVEADAAGNLVFLGRADNQVKIRGQRVELDALDLTIRQLDAVAEAAAVVAEDETHGPGVVAVIQPEPGSTVTLRDVQRHVARHHPRVAVPVDVVIVNVLARTGTGKVDRNAALEQAQRERQR